MQNLGLFIFAFAFLTVPFIFNSCEGGFRSGNQSNSTASQVSPQQVLNSFCPVSGQQKTLVSKLGRYKQRAKINIENLNHEHLVYDSDGRSYYNLNITASNDCFRQTESGFARDLFLANMSGELSIQSYRYDVPVESSLDQLVDLFDEDPCVLRVSPNTKMKLAQVNSQSPVTYQYPRPNDPFLMEQKHLTAIQAIEGFSYFYNPALTNRGATTSIVVGVLDSGVDWQHPDLQGNLWNFTVTNSQNGMIEGPFYGVNATTLDPLVSSYEDYNPVDLVGHGTHVIGLISALTNNQQGGLGLAPAGIKVMPIKIHGPVQNSSTEGIYATAVFNGARWAAARGANILNMSFGAYYEGPGRDLDFEILFEELLSDGVVVVLATGNGDGANPRREIDNVTYSVIPAIYGAAYEGVINVGATQAENKLLAPFSHYSKQFVEIAAPGTQLNSGQLADGLLSTYPRNLGSNTGYEVLSGTSQSAPLVSAAAAHVMRYVALKTGQVPAPCLVEGILKFGSEKNSVLEPYIKDGNHLNLKTLGQALEFLFE